MTFGPVLEALPTTASLNKRPLTVHNHGDSQRQAAVSLSGISDRTSRGNTTLALVLRPIFDEFLRQSTLILIPIRIVIVETGACRPKLYAYMLMRLRTTRHTR